MHSLSSPSFRKLFFILGCLENLNVDQSMPKKSDVESRLLTVRLGEEPGMETTLNLRRKALHIPGTL